MFTDNTLSAIFFLIGIFGLMLAYHVVGMYSDMKKLKSRMFTSEAEIKALRKHIIGPLTPPPGFDPTGWVSHPVQFQPPTGFGDTPPSGPSHHATGQTSPRNNLPLRGKAS